MISISFDLAAISPQDARALGAMLAVKADDGSVPLVRGEIQAAFNADLAKLLSEPNARMRPSAGFDAASIIVRKTGLADLGMADNIGRSACADDCVHPDHHHQVLPEGPVEPECPLFAGCPEVPQTRVSKPAAEPEPVAAPEPTQGHIPAEPMVPKRKRRTKEQMEADELAAAGVKNPDEKLSEVVADPIQAGPVTAPAVASAAAGGSSKPEVSAVAAPEPTGDDLRAALKIYSKTHGMPKAIELIKDFGCERISELETKPLADRLEFMKLAQNA